MSESISIVIPSYNSWRTVALCLDSLDAVPGIESTEVVFVDSSVDGTDKLVAEKWPWVRLIHLSQRTLPGKGRNLGVRESSGDLIAFLDADCVVPTHYLNAIRESFDLHPEQAAIVGCVENHNPGIVSWLSFISEFNGFFGRQARRPMTSLPTYCAVYRREVFERYGGFPEELWPGEDAVLSARLAEAGEPVFLEPDLRVAHHNRDTPSEFFRHQYRIGEGFAVSRRLLPQLPGASTLRKNRLSLIPMAGLRAWRMLRRSFAASPACGFRILALFPFYLLGLVQWIRGAWRGCNH